ncbi:RNA helicase [Bertholletia excelsa]
MIELHSKRCPFRSADVESLIRQLYPAPQDYFVNSTGDVAGRLFFRLQSDAADAIVLFWRLRLAGDHLMTPCAEFLSEELEGRVKFLFVSHVKWLLEGELVQRVRKRAEILRNDAVKISALLRKPKTISVLSELQQKRKALLDEINLILNRTEEFKSAMKSVLTYIEGDDSKDSPASGELEVLHFGNGLHWNQIHHIVMRECRRLEDGLPIYAFRLQILRQFVSEKVMVLIGETGSGKSTQLVQFLVDSGVVNGSVVCTQPRKIAAISLAKRVAEESIGCYGDNSVICCPSYSSIQGFQSKILFMTDHSLLQYYMKDNNLSGVSCIIVDEAHERSLNTDLLLAVLKKLIYKRDDLRLIIMSATVDAIKISDYFCGCGTFRVVGRSFPVEINYVPGEHIGNSGSLKSNAGNYPPYVSDVVTMATEIHRSENETGAILAFLTSQMEVEWAREKFQSPSAVSLALHGKQSHEEQNFVFQDYNGKRKIIFATNVAETSLTIPGVKYVIDSGMVKESMFDPKSGMNVLRVCRISQSSANQRAGRAGRTESGKCYRLYSECDFQSMPSQQEPEIRKVHLAVAVLRILALGIKNIQDFDFVDAPGGEAIDMAIRNLVQLGAATSKNGDLQLTADGHCIVKLGIEPRLGKIVLDCCRHGLYREGVALSAVMANASSIFCRVGTVEDKLKSDCLKVQFCHVEGDLFTLLSVYREWESMPRGTQNKWCWENSINAKSMRRCHDVVLELEQCLGKELGITIPRSWLWNPHAVSEMDKRLKEVILSSLVENVAMYSGYDRLGYEVALTGEHFLLHPSCSLHTYSQKPDWVVFSELMSTPNQYLVCVTAIDYDSLFSLGSPLFNVLNMKIRKLQVRVLTGFTSAVLKRFCGKSNSSLTHFISHLQTTFMDKRIGIEIDSDKNEMQLFASSEDIEKIFGLVADAMAYETKWLRNECLEKCLYHGFRRGVTPPVALFGAGAEIKHLELEQRCLTVNVFHSKVNSFDDKELLMFLENFVSGVCGFHKYIGSGQDAEDNEKWGRITFLSPDAAQNAVGLNNVEFFGSLLKVVPAQASDHRMASLPAVRAQVFWPRRESKGYAVVKCERNEARHIVSDCSYIQIRGMPLRCEISRKHGDSLYIKGFCRETSEQELLEMLRRTTDRKILDLFVVRGPAVDYLPRDACETELLKEISSIMPGHSPSSNCCQVKVFPPEPKDFSMRALITFDGRHHLEAAKALDHIEGKVLAGCLPWQKIRCQQMFQSSLSCPAPVYAVIKTQLDSLLNGFRHRKGLSCNLEKNANGSYRVKISANGNKAAAELRKPLEQLMNGKLVTNASLSSNVLQLLFSRDGFMIMKSVQQETDTYILFDKQNLNIRIFGSEDRVELAEQKLAQVLLALHEKKQLEICLRDRAFPHDLMKKLVEKFGPDLQGLKLKLPEVELILDARCHVIHVCGSKEVKQKVEELICDFVESLDVNVLAKPPGVQDPTCSICLCEVENSYKLAACGHEFCQSCLVEQLESAIRSHDGFPITCTHEGCSEQIWVTDLRYLLSCEKLEELFSASLSAFVASSGNKYRFCRSPDCPSVYRVSESGTTGEAFVCGACRVETCTRCHLEYHPFMSCERYKAMKDDPDLSLKEWRQGKDNVKECPVCSYTIEKTEGCNHMTCKCGKHICWVCLKYFSTSGECYAHMGSAH